MNENLQQNTEKPAVLVFHISEFFKKYGISIANFSQTVYDSPFFIYDKSLKSRGPKFEDEKPICDEDCNEGFTVLKVIWNQYVGKAETPCFSRVFKIITDLDTDDFYVESVYGFVPGYDMDSAIKTITEQNFEVIRWDEFWDWDFEG